VSQRAHGADYAPKHYSDERRFNKKAVFKRSILATFGKFSEGKIAQNG
jgi:hypothetical protein